ncbi:E3 ubiquitin-protein ligase ZNF598-like [Triticum dicoccoides]|uniref:E3 ubiquitin-protein ligase ZNF598-like n=1 Tax=Triticum dicoccoides TaxID=85692 RepID=UPI00188EC0FE|nr:E3 ubiquitin-protein ligase ZNF598-like [Triticum dicoccoides]
MDDSCAVCADALEWVAYGPCGHREVCSTCVVRLRFVVGDRHCCICKTDCPSVFVTKAMGDYTRVISDFSALPAAASEGKAGEYWYHEDSRAYFDDADHYKMIRAMCRLSCSVCERIDEGQAAQAKGRDSTFKTIGLLRGHLSDKHGLRMCKLCLEGRKVFICQQKLYTQEQMARHTQTGDTEVDGSEVERGGFAGHPICEYCKRAFYGDNELYAHMTRDHYSCHICQRRHPGQYDYFRNYNDLEMHFRKDHFLCEDDACLAKKFVVFQSDAEINRHNAMEHGGRMSRAQRNAALQIPTSFMYQRNEQDQRRGRGRGRSAHHDRPDGDFSLPVDGSATADHGLGSRLDSAGGSTMLADESLFPPLPGSSNKCSASTQQGLQGLPKTTLASRLQQSRKGTVKVLYSGRPQTAQNPEIVPHASTSTHTCPTPERERNGSATAEHGLGSRVDSVAGPLQSSSVSSASSRRRSLGNGRVLEQLSFPHLQGRDIPDARMDAVSDETSFAPLSEHQSSNTLALNQSSRGSERLGDESLFPPLPGLSNKGSASTQQGLQSLAKNTFASRFQQPRKGAMNSCRSQTTENPEIVPDFSTSTEAWPTPDQGLHLSGSSHLRTVPQSTRDNGLVPPASSGSAWNSRAPIKMKHSVSTPNLVSGGSSTQASSSTAYGNKHQVSPQSSQPLPLAEDVRQANNALVEKMRAAFGMDEDRFSAFKEIASEYRHGVIGTSEYLSYVEQFGISHLVPEMAILLPDPLKQTELAEAYYANMRSKSLKENGSFETITLKEKLLQEGEAAVLSKDGYRSSKERTPLSAGGDQVAISKASSTSRYVGKGGGSSSSNNNSKQSKKTSKFLRARLGDNSLAMLDFRHPDDVSPERNVWKKGVAQKLFSGNAKK